MRWLVLALALIAAPAAAQRFSLAVDDQAAQDPTLSDFRAQLLQDIRNRDTEAVIAAACPDIYLSHGGNGGPEELRANLTASGTGPDVEPYWTALEQTVAAPGYFDEEGEFWMPVQWQIRLPAKVDPFIAYFVNGTRVSLRDGPGREAPVLNSISHEVVLIPAYDPQAEYQKVVLTDGTAGYMHRDYLWSMVGYRAALTRSAMGRWQLCTFVTGD